MSEPRDKPEAEKPEAEEPRGDTLQGASDEAVQALEEGDEPGHAGRGDYG